MWWWFISERATACAARITSGSWSGFNLLPAYLQKVLRVITDMIWLFFNIVIIVYALKVHQTMVQFPGYSAVLQIPMHYVFFIVPVGFFLMSLRLIQDYVKLLIPRRGRRVRRRVLSRPGK